MDANIGLPFGNGPIAEAQAAEDDEEIESNSFESGSGSNSIDEQSDSGTDSRIVCINNNNNIIVEEEAELPTCEECFTENLNAAQLEDVEEYLSGTTFEDLEGLCAFLSDPTNPNTEKLLAFQEIFIAVIIPVETFSDILECLEELGLITVGGGDGPER